MGEIVADGPWAGFEIIHTYTRQQAIADGVLIDLTTCFPSDTRMFKFPLACTAAVWAKIEEAARLDEVEPGLYVWDICWMALRKIQEERETQTLYFDVCLPLRDGVKPSRLKMVCGPTGPDDPSSCLTLMLPEED